MKFRCLLLIAALASLPGLAFAGQTCGTATVVPSDGRVVDFDFVAASPSANFYEFGVTAGHSYSVEVRQDYDDPPSTLNVSLFSEAGTCTTTLAGTNDTTASEPTEPANAFRQSFTAAGNGTYSVSVTNTGANGRYVSVSVSDTTGFNVRWSTFAGFITQWGFQNTTSNQISVTITATATVGGSNSGSLTFNVPANSQVIKAIGASGADINIGANKSGFMVMSHNGPPGGMLTDAYFINPSGSVIVPAVFVPVRQGHSGK